MARSRAVITVDRRVAAAAKVGIALRGLFSVGARWARQRQTLPKKELPTTHPPDSFVRSAALPRNERSGAAFGERWARAAEFFALILVGVCDSRNDSTFYYASRHKWHMTFAASLTLLSHTGR